MDDSAWHVFFLGMITMLGGIHGFMSQGSKASMIAGLIFGGLLLFSTVLLLQENILGWLLGLLTSFLLLLNFSPKFQETGDLYPAGLLATVSVWVIGALIANRISFSHASSH